MRKKSAFAEIQAVATDYDGTLARNGLVAPDILTALVRLRSSNRKLILVTGRELESLLQILPQIGLFDRVVAENGAVLFRPSTATVISLAPPPSAEFVTRLKKLDVLPLSVGRSVVATLRVHYEAVIAMIREMSLDVQVSMNRESMMILPSGVNKGTGLEAALNELAVSFADVLGIGDAENDLTFLGRCGHAVAVANAIPAVISIADTVTTGLDGAGVAEIIYRMIGKGQGIQLKRKAQRQNG